MERILLIKKAELLNDILQETEIVVECSVLDVCFSFDVGCSMFDVGRSSFNMFDVHLSKQPRMA
jgi:hypothetical protein